MNLLAVICALILILCLVRGIHRGFLSSLLSIISFVLSIICTAAVTPALYNAMSGNEAISAFFDARALDLVSNNLSAFIEGSADASSGTGSLAGIAGILGGVALENKTVQELLAARVAGIMIGIAAFLIAWVVISLILAIIAHIFRKALKNRTLRTIDRILGVPVGLVKGLIIVWIVLGIASLIALLPAGSGIREQIDASAFLTALQSVNPLGRILSSVIGNLI